MLGTVLTVLAHPLAGRVGAVAALGFALLAVGQCAAKDDARRQADKLRAEITAPVTGWAARLETCNASVGTLKRSVAAQNAEVEAQAQAAKARIAEAERIAQAARAGRAAAERRAQRLTSLAARPSGDVCADVRAVDAALLETLR